MSYVTVGDLLLVVLCLTFGNSIGKHNGLVHILRTLLVHSLLCKSMKRCLVMAKVWVTRLVVSCTHLWNVVWQFLKYGIWKLYLCCCLPSIQCLIIKHVLAPAMDEIYKVLDVHTFSECLTCFNSISKRNVLCIYWMVRLCTNAYAALWNALWLWLKYGLSTCCVL